ncbi:hypothetical protein IFM89_009725 [Coptis chinensis]|uniref:sucrose synthase n=1 Tax=Coptis chinensis TaxID=261450 RepID=A0A835LL03_9MAGN|nr:hypothetical protein IFM89_009725 [Coptis chinensis]
MEHNASNESVREELRTLHPDDSQIVVLKHKVWHVNDLIQISRSIGDAHLKKAEFNREPLISQGGLKRILEKFTWQIYSERLMTLAGVYGFWKYVSNLERHETRHYLEMFYALKASRPNQFPWLLMSRQNLDLTWSSKAYCFLR